MKPAWRGVVFHGEVWAWPTVLFDHRDAFAAWPSLGEGQTCRWRQWEPGGRIDFDPGASDEDKALVEAWIKAAST
jgi:hypothetical protein